MLEALKKFFLLLFSQVPVLAVFAAWWFNIIQDPLIVAGLAVLSEGVGLLFAFGQKVWAVLEPDLVKATAEAVKVKGQNLFSRFRRRYNDQVYYDHRFLNTSGLRTKGGAILELDQVFVSLRVAHSDLQQARKNPVIFRDLTSNEPIWLFLRQLKKQPVNALAIIGPPGSGKTTLLQHLALTFTANKQRKYRLKGYTPLLLFLREHVNTIVQEKPNLAELAHAHFSDGKRYPTLQPPPQWFARQLEAGRCIVLLDGLDEVAKVEQRLIVSEWVDTQIRTYHHCPFVLSARPGGYKEAPLNQAHVLEVQLFDRKQVKAFIHKWYFTTKMILSGKNDAGIRQDAEREANDLLRRLRIHPALEDLAINPLLLTMIALVHNHRGVLPGSRAELYNEICDVFLEHWQRAKKLNDPLNAKQKRTALQPLAAYMMQQPDDDDANRRTISTAEALRIMSPHLREVGFSDEQIPHFLASVQKSSLILETNVGQWSFAHLTFQEYLCAAHWQQTGQTPNNWEPLVRDSWWHETLRLYAAQADATRLAVACLTPNTLQTLTLASELDEESLKMNASLRQAIRTHLNQSLEANQPALRKLAAEAYLNRRLNTPFLPLDDQQAIDSHFITCAEYQLFIDERQKQRKYHQPDHWTTFTFPTRQAQIPITGVRFEDAQAFCDWLSKRTGNRYRLPTAREIKQFPIENLPRFLANWGQDGQLYGLPLESKKILKENLQSNGSSFLSYSNITFKNNFDKNKYISLNISQALDLQCFLDLGKSRSRYLAREGFQTLYFVLKLAFDLNRELNGIRDRDKEIKLIKKIIKAKNYFNDDNLFVYIETDKLDKAKKFIQNMLTNELTEVQKRQCILITTALTAVQAPTLLEQRQAHRQLAMRILEYAYLGSQMQGQADPRPWWKRWRWWNKPLNLSERQQIYLELYWFYQLIDLREKDKMPAWEGIRIVREVEE